MSKNKLEVLAKVLTEKIKNFEKEIKTEDIGKIISIADGIAYVSGLDQAMFGELVLINKKHLGMILSLEIDSVGIVLFSNPNDIKENDLVNRTKQVIAVPYGDQMLGRVIDSMGNPLDNLKELDKSKLSNIFKNAFDIMAREAVNEPLETGILAIDSMVPIGKGQRELIIGDRQTGKTTIAIDTIINQKNKNVICIYVAIGQKNSSLNQIIQKLKKHGAFDYTLIINTAASDLPAMQYIAPYTGITIAEEWMKQGKDVLIIYDDLSKHAIAYRTLSLLLRRPPGREAYPGDIFYIHSQLLERSAKLNKSLGGGSITAFPVIETFANDISAYIPTNVISITDGQIFMISSLFNAGQRPAIDIGFSVSRVGSSAQTQAIKYATSSLKLELAQYFEILDFAQFGSDLDPNTLRILNHGNKVMNIMKQKQYSPINQEEQVFLLLSIKNKLINDLDEKDIFVFKEKLIFAINNDKEYKQVANILKKEKALTNDLELRINNLISNLIDYNFKVGKN